jgi:hypothetical protein
MQAVTDCRDIGGDGDADAGHRCACEVAFGCWCWEDSFAGLRSDGIRCADVEVWLLAIVADEEGAAIFEAAVKVDHRQAPAALLGGDAVSRLQDNAPN